MTALAPPRLGPHNVRAAAREITRGGLAGVLTGLVMGGFGGRLAMRVSSLVDPTAHGRTTEAGATVGEFTLGGTFGLVLFGGLFTGLGLAVMWVIVRRWLPSRGVARYSVAALIGVAMGGRFAIDGRNIDFLILDPKLSQVTIFIVLAGLTGAAVVRVDAWLERRLPVADGSSAPYLPVAVGGLLIGLPLLRVAFFVGDDCGCVSPPRLPGALLTIVGLLTAATWWRTLRGSNPPPWLLRSGQLALALMIAAGVLHLGGEIAHFV